jgi:uncharacterized membrane protein
LATEQLGFRKDVATGVVVSFQLTATVALLYIVRSLYAAVLSPSRGRISDITTQNRYKIFLALRAVYG